MLTKIALLAILFLATLSAVAQPVLPGKVPIKMTVMLPKTVSLSGEIPIKLTFENKDGISTRVNSAGFQFILVDDEGVQLATNPFLEEAVSRDVTLDGEKPSYHPRLTFSPDCKGLMVGKRYVIVCVFKLPGLGSLAGSRTFELTK